MRNILEQIRRIRPLDGGLILGPRPGKRSKAGLAGMGLSHLCTLLTEQEGAESIKGMAADLGCDWVWLPIAGGSLENLTQCDTEGLITQLASAIENTPAPRLYLHCSAGIHRTGFLASVLLRLQPVAREHLSGALAMLRPVTAAQVGPDRIELAARQAEALLRETN